MEESSRKPKAPKSNRECGVTVRFDWPTLQELDQIALFEREDRAVLLRRIIIDKIKVYERNPQYKRWQRQRAGEEERRKNRNK